MKSYKHLLPDCPVCGEVNGGFMSSTRWRPFEGSACSEACGMAAKAGVEKAIASDEYKALNDRLSELYNEQFSIKMEIASLQIKYIQEGKS